MTDYSSSGLFLSYAIIGLHRPISLNAWLYAYFLSRTQRTRSKLVPSFSLYPKPTLIRPPLPLSVQKPSVSCQFQYPEFSYRRISQHLFQSNTLSSSALFRKLRSTKFRYFLHLWHAHLSYHSFAPYTEHRNCGKMISTNFIHLCHLHRYPSRTD